MKISNAQDRSSSGYPISHPPKGDPVIPNPNAKDQSASGYPANWKA